MVEPKKNYKVEIEGANLAFVEKKRNKIQDQKLKCLVVSFKALNLLIQEMYDVKGVEHDL
jgi:hypothetical protein